MNNGTVQKVSASYGVLVDQQGDTLVISVHPFLQVCFWLALVIMYAAGVWVGKRPANDGEDDETEQEGEQ